MKSVRKIGLFLLGIVSFFTTVLCMRDTLAVRDEMQRDLKKD